MAGSQIPCGHYLAPCGRISICSTFLLFRFVGMGGKEYSGVRKKEAGNVAFDKTLADYVPALKAALKAQSVTGER